jgi:hypothetical protein
VGLVTASPGLLQPPPRPVLVGTLCPPQGPGDASPHRFPYREAEAQPATQQGEGGSQQSSRGAPRHKGPAGTSWPRPGRAASPPHRGGRGGRCRLCPSPRREPAPWGGRSQSPAEEGPHCARYPGGETEAQRAARLCARSRVGDWKLRSPRPAGFPRRAEPSIPPSPELQRGRSAHVPPDATPHGAARGGAARVPYLAGGRTGGGGGGVRLPLCAPRHQLSPRRPAPPPPPPPSPQGPGGGARAGRDWERGGAGPLARLLVPSRAPPAALLATGRVSGTHTRTEPARTRARTRRRIGVGGWSLKGSGTIRLPGCDPRPSHRPFAAEQGARPPRVSVSPLVKWR